MADGQKFDKLDISTCGKFILFGEHFVLYDCFAAALPLRSRRLQIRRIDGSAEERGNDPELVKAIMHAWQIAGRNMELAAFPGGRLFASSDIAIEQGNGSSAAISVAVALLIAQSLQKAGNRIPEKRILQLAIQIESEFHGRSSGIDPTVVFYEKPVIFQPAQATRFWQWPFAGYCLVLALTGKRARTNDCIAAVRNFQQTKEQRFERLIGRYRSLQDEALSLLGSAYRDSDCPDLHQNARRLGELLDGNHSLLSELQLSLPEIERLLEAGKSAGALGGKLSGSGRGGAVVFLAEHRRAHAIEKALAAAGAQATYIEQPDN